ncbi:receptor-type tyrosine-protein phosphatase eta [Ictalurus furcatus]|uniref:receptor-type tyrosine-protein phosphatase eta n=1 Tax=Ictalurus furcatus TaxID=66913 RepID=UPI0023509E30|nr:receptor-type tyrosine-protein phosphatase eta [Ictalurus furcatus]
MVSIICAERDYFYEPDNATWDKARLNCQECYKDLTTITPANAEILGLNLTSDYWIGLRQNINGSKFWSRWANGEPVLYQNWYPGHPVPKKKPEPQPTCPTPPAINNTKIEVMQCPAFTKLCACLNSSDDNDNYLTWETNNSSVMWCPALAELCACLNSSREPETSITESTTVFTTSNFVTSPTPTTLAPTSSPASTISNDLEPEYIEDSCVALLSFGMWQEKKCSEALPYICYDERFYGDVAVSNETTTGGNLSWSEAGINISQYKIEINGNHTANVTSETSYNMSGLDPGMLYRVQVIPVKCGRDLNAQNISFYTLPEKIINLMIVSVGTEVISLSWNASRGTNVSYIVNTEPGNVNTTCLSKTCSINKLTPGQKYNFTVRAVVNVSIYGDSNSTTACTKPSKVGNLTSSNNENDTIYATWDSLDENSMLYNYTITLTNTSFTNTYIANANKSKRLESLTPGTKYTLSVLAIEPNCKNKGETTSIGAYTIPKQVDKLELESTNNSITAKWALTTGNFAWFIVNISSAMSENISDPVKTTDYTCNFTSLEAAALYTVTIRTYVAEDLKPSHPVSISIYTRPTSPGKASVQSLNKTAVYLSWGIPANSEKVKNINYSVTYTSDFWHNTGNLNLIGNTSVTIDGLKSGTKYKFSIRVLAGNLSSEPSETTGLTEATIRNLSIAMLCSSSTQLYCMENSTMHSVLEELKNLTRRNFEDNVFWNLTLREKK